MRALGDASSPHWLFIFSFVVLSQIFKVLLCIVSEYAVVAVRSTLSRVRLMASQKLMVSMNSNSFVANSPLLRFVLSVFLTPFEVFARFFVLNYF